MIISTATTNFLILIINFITSILAARLLGAEARGELALVLLYPQMIATMGLIGLDRGIAIVGGQKKIKNPMGSIISLTLTIGCLIMAVSYIVVSRELRNSELIKLSQVYILYVLPLYFFLFSSSLFNGIGNFFEYNISRLSFYGSYLFLILIFCLYNDLMLKNFVFANLFSVYFTAITAGFLLFKSKIQKQSQYNVFLHIFKDNLIILEKTVIFIIPAIITVIAARLDQIILTNYLDVKYLGLFVVYTAFSQLIGPLANAVNVNVFHQSIVNSSQNMGRLTRMSVFIYIICLILMAVSAPFLVNLLYGKSYVEHLYCARLLLVSSFFFFISQIFNEYLKGKSKTRQDIVSSLIFLLSVAFTGYYSVPVFSITGMAASMLISNMLRFFYLMTVFCKELNIKITELLFITKDDFTWIFRTAQKMIKIRAGR